MYMDKINERRDVIAIAGGEGRGRLKVRVRGRTDGINNNT
jgi:hypothetical protein